MAFLENIFGKAFAGRKSATRSRRVPARKPARRLGIENMERRMMMSVNMTGSSVANNLHGFMAPTLLAGTSQLTGKGLAVGSSAVAVKTITLPITIAAPAAPTLTVTAYSSSQLDLAWSGVSNTGGYLVDEWINGAWKQVASVGSTTTSYSFAGLSASTTYYFDVAVYNLAGTTWANFQSATTGVAVNEPTAATPYSLASGTLFAAGGPSYLDVQQGQVGDCWLLASLAEVAARDPADIRNMFTADGTTVENGATVSLYTVRFFNNSGVAKYVTVDTELPSGGGYYDQTTNGNLWVALAEKAYAEANGAGIVTSSDDGSDSYAALSGGYPQWALQAITGKSAGDYSINPANIATDWNAGDLVVICTGSSPVSSEIVSSHCYAVVNYNASSSVPFEVFNPWGTNASGWALSTFNGNQVYGLFNANGSFLSQNFTMQGTGGGTEPGVDTSKHPGMKAATDLLLSQWALSQN